MSSIDAQIHSLVNQANGINRQIGNAQMQLRMAEEKKRKFEQRLREVQNVKNSLYNSFDGVVSAIRRNQDDTKGKIAQATQGLSHEGALVSILQRDREKDTESDQYGSQIHENLRSEISRCEQEIASANAQITQYKATIDNLSRQKSQLLSNANRLSRSPEASVRVSSGSW